MLSDGFTEGSAEGVRMLGRVACADALGRKRASVDGAGRVYGKTGGFGLDRGGAVQPRCARTDSADAKALIERANSHELDAV
jgi:hypothetical protein